MGKNKNIILITGPTASGKTSLAITLAKKFNSEIISADSRQIYRRMDIGTAKPSSNELLEVPHHFISIIEPDQNYNAAEFASQANLLIKEMFEKNNFCIVCGGTGFYIKALFNGLDLIPDTDMQIRKEIEEQYVELGLTYLQTEIKKHDPLYFDVVDKENPRRLMRALEVIKQYGKPYSSWLGKNKSEFEYNIIQINLDVERNELYFRINSRVDEMISLGLEEEVKSLLAYSSCQSMQTVGYKEFMQYFNHELTMELVIDKIKQHSRNYAKRQITWFKKHNIGQNFDPDDLLSIYKYIEERIK